MADQIARPADLGEPAIRRGVELLYFGYGQLTRAIDETLATQGLGRAHHRALYFIARQPDLSVGELLALLHITKQSLARVLLELGARDLVESRPGTLDRRQRRLRLTPHGVAMEAALFEGLRSQMARAYQGADAAAVSGFWRVLEGLVPADEIDRVIALQRD